MYYYNTGLQAITSLLLGTTLRPRMGDPTSSVPMSVHRINEMLFLGSRLVVQYSYYAHSSALTFKAWSQIGSCP